MRWVASGQRPTPTFARHFLVVAAAQYVAYGQRLGLNKIFVRLISSDLTGFLLLTSNLTQTLLHPTWDRQWKHRRIYKRKRKQSARKALGIKFSGKRGALWLHWIATSPTAPPIPPLHWSATPPTLNSLQLFSRISNTATLSGRRQKLKNCCRELKMLAGALASQHVACMPLSTQYNENSYILPISMFFRAVPFCQG